MLALRTYGGIDLERFAQRYGVSLLEAHGALIERWGDENLVELDGSSLKPTVRGLAVLSSTPPPCDETGPAAGPRTGATFGGTTSGEAVIGAGGFALTTRLGPRPAGCGRCTGLAVGRRSRPISTTSQRRKCWRRCLRAAWQPPKRRAAAACSMRLAGFFGFALKQAMKARRR